MRTDYLWISFVRAVSVRVMFLANLVVALTFTSLLSHATCIMKHTCSRPTVRYAINKAFSGNCQQTQISNESAISMLSDMCTVYELWIFYLYKWLWKLHSHEWCLYGWISTRTRKPIFVLVLRLESMWLQPYQHVNTSQHN